MSIEPNVMVRVVRRFAAAPESVFDAWLDPAMVGRWMFGPGVRDEAVLRLWVDARVGGRFSFVVDRAGTQIDHVGSYLEIDRPSRLVFTWAAHAAGEEATTDEGGSRVAIEIVPRGRGCELTLTHEMDPQWAEYAARTQAGWTTMLDALARQLKPQLCRNPP